MYSSLLEQQTSVDTATDTTDATTTTRTTKNVVGGMGTGFGVGLLDYLSSSSGAGASASSGWSQGVDNHHNHLSATVFDHQDPHLPPPHPHHTMDNSIYHSTTSTSTSTSTSLSSKINFAGHLLAIKRLLQKSIAEAPAELVHFLGTINRPINSSSTTNKPTVNSSTIIRPTNLNIVISP